MGASTEEGRQGGAGDTDIVAVAERETVVIFRSSITDLGPLRRLMDERGVPYHEEVMAMGSPAQRARFDALKAATGWRTLPQVFVSGRFVGGIEEASREIADHSREAPAAGGDGDPVMGRILGYTGLIPFAAAALAGFMAGVEPLARQALLGYGAVILSFIGAVHWGLALRQAPGRPAAMAMAFSVIPALYAWAAVAAAPAWLAAWLLAAGFLGMRAVEMRAFEQALPPWYRRMRNVLTLGATAAMVVGALSIYSA